MSTGNSLGNGRMDMGFYALSKLASAGAVLCLLSLLHWLWPEQAASPSSIVGIKLPLEHWIYGYALIASLAADAVASFFPSLAHSSTKLLALYGIAGFLFFALLTGGGTDSLWIRGMAGAIMLAMYWQGRKVFSAPSLMTLVFALILPLLLWTFI